MMEEKEIIWQERFRADLFAPDFCNQLRLEQEVLPLVEQPFYYNLDIQVPFVPLRQAGHIEEYSLQYLLGYREGEDKFGYILGKRAREIEAVFQALGYQIQDICIFGEPMDSPYEVTLALWKGKSKEYFANGAVKPVHHTTVVIPSKPDFLTLLQQTLAKHYARMEEAAWDEEDR